MADGSTTKTPREHIWAVVLVSVVVIIAYCNSFRGPFIFDDIDGIQRNPDIRTLYPHFQPISAKNTLTGRTVLRLTFAQNYAIGGEQVWIYHLTNVAIHFIAALVLYGIVRRTLQLAHFPQQTDAPSGGESTRTCIAAVAAAAWAAHPLNTEAVTYCIQRAESLAGLFYLLVVYSLIRQAEKSPGWNPWATATVAFSALGMASKEVVFTAPLIALLYDRTFLAGSFAKALKRRAWTYLALFATCGIVIWSIVTNARGVSVGYSSALTALDYARTQLNVIAHYLRLSLWPSKLLLDYYGWPIARAWGAVSAAGWSVLALAIATLIALWKKPRLGFVGAWIFIVLAPTSSVVPIITEIAAEHRMYLPLAAIVTVSIVTAWSLLRALDPPPGFSWVCSIALLVVLTTLTHKRNQTYASAESIWRDVITKSPGNARAHVNLGFAYAQEGTSRFPAGSAERIDLERRAITEYRIAIELQSDAIRVVPMLGAALEQAGELDEAERFYEQAITGYPAADRISYVQLGKLKFRRGDWSAAAQNFREATALAPDDPEAHYLLALAYEQAGDKSAARREFQIVQALSPGYGDVAGWLAK